MKAKLTKRTVDATKPAASPTFVWDTGVIGFGLRVTPNGTKSYVLQYTVRGRKRRYTIGRHGSPWTPTTARDAAIGLLAERGGWARSRSAEGL